MACTPKRLKWRKVVVRHVNFPKWKSTRNFTSVVEKSIFLVKDYKSIGKLSVVMLYCGLFITALSVTLFVFLYSYSFLIFDSSSSSLWCGFSLSITRWSTTNKKTFKQTQQSNDQVDSGMHIRFNTNSFCDHSRAKRRYKNNTKKHNNPQNTRGFIGEGVLVHISQDDKV